MFSIRSIQQQDDPALAKVVRDTLAEFGANHPGTVFFDPTTDHLSDIFKRHRSWYFVAEIDGEVVGGGGIYPTDGLPDDTCELVKMYLKPQARGAGIGKKLIELSIAKAKEFGYKNIYLETMPELKQAMKVYEKFGFEYLNGPMGNSGHFGCKIWMKKKLDRV